jgi:hypothetical protein
MSADELHDHDRLRQLYLGATEIFESAASNRLAGIKWNSSSN